MTQTMAPGLRKLALTVHVTCSVGLIGAIASFLLLTAVGLTTANAQMVRSVYPAMDWIARLVIVPLAVAALLSGIIQSLGTPWGLIRHYWIVAKLVLTAFATTVLLAKLPLIAYAAHLAREVPLASDGLHFAALQLLVHAIGGLLMLLAPAVLSIYKPRGLTAYGRRMQAEIYSASNSVTREFNVSPSPLGHRGAAIISLRRSYVLVFFVVAAHVVLLHAIGNGLHHH